jgi:hypothetical protein
VRSRGAGREAGRDPDLIEAGLSEAAGWRAPLWGLCLRPVVRDTRAVVTRKDLGRLAGSGETGSWRQMSAAAAVLAAIAAIPGRNGMEVPAANGRILAGAIGVRCGRLGAASSSDHEVSCQKDGRAGIGRGKKPMTTKVPPQHGQRSGRCGGSVSSTGLAAGSGCGMSRSR